jgi:SAM-dependent methyltransferase
MAYAMALDAATPAIEVALMTSSDTVRRAVEKTYGKSAPTTGKKLAGYSDEQIAAVGDVPFYGCGNPLAYAQVKPGETVLDLGSGAGFDLILAAEAVGSTGKVIGVDMTDAMIEKARANVVRAGHRNVEVRKGIIEALPIDNASVDWVISNCVISLSPEKQQVFSEVARVLKPGGKMAISDIVVDAKLGWVLKRLTRIAPEIAMARAEDVYLEAMKRAGLVDVTIADRKIYEPDELLGLFGERFGAKTASRIVAGHLWSSKFTARRA